MLGVDVSTKMLGRARSETATPTVEYQFADLNVFDFDAGSADLVFSSLTLHDVRDLNRLLSTILTSMTPGGSFVFSVEHPIYGASTMQRFETRRNGERVWSLDNSLIEGERATKRLSTATESRPRDRPSRPPFHRHVRRKK